MLISISSKVCEFIISSSTLIRKKILNANYEMINKWSLKDIQFSMHLVYFPRLVPQLPDQGQ